VCCRVIPHFSSTSQPLRPGLRALDPSERDVSRALPSRRTDSNVDFFFLFRYFVSARTHKHATRPRYILAGRSSGRRAVQTDTDHNRPPSHHFHHTTQSDLTLPLGYSNQSAHFSLISSVSLAGSSSSASGAPQQVSTPPGPPNCAGPTASVGSNPLTSNAVASNNNESQGRLLERLLGG
jgi:hypothetical protein